MTTTYTQLDLFSQYTLNVTFEIKRRMRIMLGRSGLSRDEVVDRMNKVAVQEGMRSQITKATIDNWVKDSDAGRLPSPAWLTIFCHTLKSSWPIAAMLSPLKCEVLEGEDVKVLAYGKAEIERKKAARRARVAMENLEV